jgi:hypothetical protein
MENVVEFINEPWHANNYIAMEPLQKLVLQLEPQERKIAQLLHLARLRGGISDLLEILVLEISDDQKFGSSVANALIQLESWCYSEFLYDFKKVFET